MDSFGDRLRLLRNERKWHQSELGERLELSPSAIGSYERNLREPSYFHLVKIADLFGVSVDYLLCRTAERMTVADYAMRNSFTLSELLSDYNVTLDGKELTPQLKARLHDIALAILLSES